MQNGNKSNVVAEWTQHPRLRLFEKSWAGRQRLRQVSDLLGQLAGKTGLDIGGIDGNLSYHLRRLGGSWTHADFTRRGAERIEEVTGEEADVIRDNTLSYEDESFDVLVVTERLECLEKDYAFIAECHRVLRPRGSLVIMTPRASGGLVPALARMTGLQAGEGQPRRGYTEAQLFDIVKDGFDVETVRPYSRFFCEVAELLTGLLVRRARRAGGYTELSEDDETAVARVLRVNTWMFPVSWVADKLDFLMVFSKGHHLAARANRKIWRSRRAPVLTDGRSIADAAINTKIGTAAPF